MSEILKDVFSAKDSFCESAFDDIEEQGLTRSWIMKFIAIDLNSCESNQQFEVIVAIFFHLVDELYAKGCSKSEICALARLSAQYWQDSLDRSLQDSVRSLQSSLEPLVPRPVSQRAAELYLKYTVASFLQHFHLYRACLLAERRQGLRLRRAVTAEAPDVPLPLREGRKPDEHQYHCQLREIDTEEQLARSGRTAQRLADSTEVSRRQREIQDRAAAAAAAATFSGTDDDDDDGGGAQADDKYPNELIRDCLEANVRQMRLRVQDMAASSSIDLIYKAKKTALPRPASMGPPPRFIASSGNAERKSAASSRKSSARSKTGGPAAGDGGKKSKANK